MSKIRNLLVATAVLALASCQEDQDVLKVSPLSDTTNYEIAVSDEAINGIINSIPSPLETTTIIRESGLKYDESYLNPYDNADNYKSKYSKSFAVGVYSADLGYLNLYEKNFAAINYIITVHQLAGQLDLEQFFDFETLKRIASTNRNLDSLLYISTSCFNKMDNYLRKNKRSDQSSLIIIGAWMEGLYFETRMADGNASQKIKESIGSQKVAINNITAILENYKKIPYFENLIKLMTPLKNEFDKVQISYSYEEPETKEVNGELVIVEKSKSEVQIPDDVYQNIIKYTAELRNGILTIAK